MRPTGPVPSTHLRPGGSRQPHRCDTCSQARGDGVLAPGGRGRAPRGDARGLSQPETGGTRRATLLGGRPRPVAARGQCVLRTHRLAPQSPAPSTARALGRGWGTGARERDTPAPTAAAAALKAPLPLGTAGASPRHTQERSPLSGTCRRVRSMRRSRWIGLRR